MKHDHKVKVPYMKGPAHEINNFDPLFSNQIYPKIM